VKLYRKFVVVDRAWVADLPDLGAWLRDNYLHTPPELWAIMAEIQTWDGPRKRGVWVVTVEDSAVVLAVRRGQSDQDEEEYFIELASDQPIPVT
jgi:hypothetical protein